MAAAAAAAFGVATSRASAPGLFAITVVFRARGVKFPRHIVTNAGIGRGSGGVHGHRARKGRRRRTQKSEGSDQDETIVCKGNSDEEDSNTAKVSGCKSDSSKRLRNKTSNVEDTRQVSAAELTAEEVAPVAVTIVSDPELFESVSKQQHEGASENPAAGASEHWESENDGTDTDTSKRTETIDLAEDSDAVDRLEAANKAQEDTDKAGVVSETISGIQIQVVEQVSHVAEQVAQIGHKVVDDVLPEKVVEQAGQVAQAVEQVALPVVEQVATAAAQVTEQVAGLLTSEDDIQSDDEFEAYRTSDLPEFRGIRGLENFTVLQEDHSFVTVIHDFYLFMLKKSVTEFALAMFAAPVAISVIFTLLYLPQIQGLAFGEFGSGNMQSSEGGLQLSAETIFRVFMFSVSLSTGLEPELEPVTPYTLVLANINALVAQLLFVCLSGAVFARLSQPSQPIRCSSVALVSRQTSSRRDQNSFRVFMTRYVLAGPQPCELVDVKVDLTYKYNAITSAGTYFRATQSLKLIRSEVAYLNHGMLVRHIIDESSPLYRRTPEMLNKEDAIFTLSVVGLERSSMQSVFHAQHYSIDDGHVIWDAEFEDMILISKKNRRIVDHSRLSQWRRA